MAYLYMYMYTTLLVFKVMGSELDSFPVTGMGMGMERKRWCTYAQDELRIVYSLCTHPHILALALVLIHKYANTHMHDV